MTDPNICSYCHKPITGGCIKINNNNITKNYCVPCFNLTINNKATPKMKHNARKHARKHDEIKVTKSEPQRPAIR